MNGRKAITALILFLAIMLGACNASSVPEPEQSNSAQKDQIVLTGLFYENLPAFEALVESTYPDIDLQMERSAMATYDGDNLRRLKNGHGKDLIFTGIPYGEVSEYVMDMSAHNFTTRFEDSIMSVLRSEGKTKFLPLPSVYRGIILNQTLTEELGMALPTNQQEFLAVLDAAIAQGKGVDDNGYPFAAGNLDAIYLGEILMGTCIADFLGTMDGERWMAAFHDGTATAKGALNEPLQEFVALTEERYLETEYLYKVTSRTHVNADQELADRHLIACYGSGSVLSDVRARNAEDTFVMLPYFSAQGKHAWITTNPVAYVGINVAITDEDKLDAAIRVMDLLATPAGQAAIMSDTRADASYLAETFEADHTENTGLEDYITDGYVYNLNRFSSNVLWTLGKYVSQVCAGNMTMDDALAAVDAVNQGAPLSEKDDRTLVGAVSQDLLYENYNTRKEETAIGNLVADAVREQTGTDFAFVNGGGIRASLYAGDVYTSDLAETMPYVNYMLILEVEGRVIYEMLENSISTLYYNAIPGGRFLQISGLHYRFRVDPSTEVNEAGSETPATAQLISVTLPDGTPVDKEKTYRICVSDYMCGQSGYDNAGDGYTMLNVLDDASPKGENVTLIEFSEYTFRDALIAYFKNHSHEVIDAELEGRIIVEKAG